MLEQWKAGSAEPPHGHPGDDMTIVIEGKMKIQFFKQSTDGKLIPDGTPITLHAGQTGYIAANRIHDAQYIEDCKLVYVHSGNFGFDAK
jgi:quercetin dioxygenase-like cupin family protein